MSRKEFRLIQGGLGNGGTTRNLPKRMSVIDSLLESLYLGLAFNFNLPAGFSVWAILKLKVLHKKYDWPTIRDFGEHIATYPIGEKE
ncbi:hypothetical protein EXS57_00875 [Candidatus Kaiserbacteria bacterium]|nr:hypothetical protein [Candidatus Kaiserbacteria bacterium]